MSRARRRRKASEELPRLKRPTISRERREAVSGDGQRLAAAQAVGEPAGPELEEAGRTLRDAFDEADGPRRRAQDDREEGRIHGVDHLAGGVREEAHEAQRLDGEAEA